MKITKDTKLKEIHHAAEFSQVRGN